ILTSLEVTNLQHPPVMFRPLGEPLAPLLHRPFGHYVERLPVRHAAHPDDGSRELADAVLVADYLELAVEERLNLEQVEAACAVLIEARGGADYGSLESLRHVASLRVVNLGWTVHQLGRDNFDGCGRAEGAGQPREPEEPLAERRVERVPVDDVVDVQQQLLALALPVLLDQARRLLEGLAVRIDLAVEDQLARQELLEGCGDVLDHTDGTPTLAVAA